MTDTQAAAAPQFQMLALEAIAFSPSPAQAERRKHFDPVQMTELALSISEKGVVQPIVVRPNGSPGTFEVVAGERRVIASRMMKLTHIPGMIHQLTDEQALDVQLIENLQREGLHPLVEAEGYEDLKARGHSIKEIAERVGKSESYVYKRLELTACIKPVRAAFFDGKIDASRALLLASIKDEAQQKECLKAFTAERWEGAWSFRRCLEHVRDEYRLALSDAPFKTEDPDLVPAAGACGKCPKNTARQPADMFGDVSKNSKAMCTDSKCYASKATAAAAIKVAAAREAGQDVIEGEAAKKIIPESSYQNRPAESSGFVSLDDHCYEDAKNRTYRQLIGKHVTSTVVVTPKDSVVTEVVRLADVKKALKDRGIKLETRSSSNSNYGREQRDKQKKAKSETLFRQALYAAVRPKLPSKLGRLELELVASTLLGEIGDDGRKEMRRLWLPDDKGEQWNAIDRIEKTISGLKDDELVRLILDSCITPDLRAHGYSMGKPEALLAAAKRSKVDVENIRKACAPAKKAKASKGSKK